MAYPSIFIFLSLNVDALPSALFRLLELAMR
jgi:hypothetical protein